MIPLMCSIIMKIIGVEIFFYFCVCYIKVFEQLNTILANVPISNPLKTPKNFAGFVFLGVIKWGHYPELG